MHCPQCIVMYVCMKQMRGKKKSPQGGDFGGGLIDARNAAQSREYTTMPKFDHRGTMYENVYFVK